MYEPNLIHILKAHCEYLFFFMLVFNRFDNVAHRRRVPTNFAAVAFAIVVVAFVVIVVVVVATEVVHEVVKEIVVERS